MSDLHDNNMLYIALTIAALHCVVLLCLFVALIRRLCCRSAGKHVARTGTSSLTMQPCHNSGLSTETLAPEQPQQGDNNSIPAAATATTASSASWQPQCGQYNSWLASSTAIASTRPLEQPQHRDNSWPSVSTASSPPAQQQQQGDNSWPAPSTAPTEGCAPQQANAGEYDPPPSYAEAMMLPPPYKRYYY
jgi:hypothetical protein